MKQLIFPILALLIVACAPKAEQEQTASESATSPALEQVWASDTLLRTPESVLYDEARSVIYVSNINMNPWEKDGNGFLSKMDPEGNILDLKWVTGLSGPKGMGILDNSLFVADIDELVEVDIETGEIKNRYPVEGTPTLNDVTVGNGVIYVSGSDSNKVFMLNDGQLHVFLEGNLGRPNGLFYEPGRLLMLTSTSSELSSIDLETKERNVLVDSLGHGDGIVPVGNGDYLASSWRGEVFYITSGWKRIQLLDTRKNEINAADIDYIMDQKLLLVPTFFDNKVVAYRLKN